MWTVHPILKAADAFAKPAHHFGNFFAPKEQHDYRQNYDQMERTQRFHNSPAFTTPLNFPDQPMTRMAAIQPSITRSSPTRRVTCSRSRCSSKGIAYFRVTPVSSLNAVIGSRSPRSLRYLVSISRSRSSALQ